MGHTIKWKCLKAHILFHLKIVFLEKTAWRVNLKKIKISLKPKIYYAISYQAISTKNYTVLNKTHTMTYRIKKRMFFSEERISKPLKTTEDWMLCIQ